MAGVLDVARYILEQKGSLSGPVLQELCRLASREGLLNREPLIFEGKFELIVSDTYPKGEICRELYEACADETVSADKLKGGNSAVLSTEEKLIINETLNRHYTNIMEQYGIASEKKNNSVYPAEDIYSDFSDEDGFTRSFNCLTEDDLTEPTRFFPAQESDSDDVQVPPVYPKADVQESVSSSIDNNVHKKSEDPAAQSDRVKDRQVYAHETMAMPDVSAFSELTGSDACKTAPINYTYKASQNAGHVHKSASQTSAKSKISSDNISKQSQTKQKSENSSYHASANKQLHKAPSSAAAVRQSQKKKSERNLNLFIAWLTTVILILVVLLVNSMMEQKKAGSNHEAEYIVTQAETLQKPSPVPYDEPEETEAVTEVPETSAVSETSEETTVSETEPAGTDTEVPSADEHHIGGAGDGRRVLDSYVSSDVNLDGKNDMIEVYKYNTDDFFYDIRYSDGSVITYTFPNGDGNRTLDYIVYDRRMDAVYAAGLNISETGIRFTQINSVTRFSIELAQGSGEKNFYINYSLSSAEEVESYFDDIEILYSYNDSDGSEIRRIIRETLK